MEFMTKAAFADRQGWSRAYVSKLVRQGRLVLTADGKVDVQASDELLAASADPSKAAVAERHRQERVEKGVYAHIGAGAAPSPALPAPGQTAPLPDYQKARARRSTPWLCWQKTNTARAVARRSSARVSTPRPSPLRALCAIC